MTHVELVSHIFVKICAKDDSHFLKKIFSFSYPKVPIENCLMLITDLNVQYYFSMDNTS